MSPNNIKININSEINVFLYKSTDTDDKNDHVFDP